MAKVNSVIDTILGEAVSGTKAQRYEDMLGVASVIDNRARLTAQTPHSIVSAPNQFGAFGKSPPKGSSAFRSLAQKAWDTVQKLGPVHNATFYATPSATKNLPSGLSPVTSTKGHQYFYDPQNRAIATSVGYVTPSASIAGPLAPQSAAQAMLSPEAYGIASAAPSAPKGMEALAPNGLKGTGPLASYSRVGLDPSVGKVLDALSKNPSAAGVTVNSGYRDPAKNAAVGGAKQSQHMKGKALDLNVKGLTDDQKQAVLDAAIEAGAKGIGLYSSGNVVHVDTRAAPAVWSNSYKGIPISKAPDWAKAPLTGLFQAGTFAVTPRTTAPTPTARPETPSAFTAAPVGKVERAALAPAAPRAPDPARFAYDVTPPSQPSGFGIVSAAQAASMPPDPMTTAKVGRLAPAISMPARPTTPTPATALQAMNKPAFAPAMTVPSSAMAAIASKVPTAPTQTFTPQPTTLMPPSVVAPPAPPAPVARVSAPVSRSVPAPAAPRATAMDVYNGTAAQAFDNTGKNMVSRDALGNISVTNQYGVTTKTTPSGVSTTSFGPVAPSANPSAISGPLSQPGISTPSKGFLGIEPAKTETGNIARGVVGSAVGSALGSTLGPIGSLIGAAIGNSIAKGKNPFDALTGNNQGMLSFNTPALGVINAFAPQTGGAFGTFPGKPTGTPGALGGKQTNNSMGGMRGISPAAADAIGKGVGGLY